MSADEDCLISPNMSPSNKVINNINLSNSQSKVDEKMKNDAEKTPSMGGDDTNNLSFTKDCSQNIDSHIIGSHLVSDTDLT